MENKILQEIFLKRANLIVDVDVKFLKFDKVRVQKKFNLIFDFNVRVLR